jgi:hypothetical protein
MEKGPLTILGMGNQALRILGMANQLLTMPGMVTQLITTLGAGKLPTTIATVMRTLCSATGMNDMTAIGGSNTISSSCWSEADTIIGMRILVSGLGIRSQL